jgi:hypothetical protein
MMIKAAVLSGAAEPVEVRDVELEEPHGRDLQYLYWPRTMGDIVEAVR